MEYERAIRKIINYCTKHVIVVTITYNCLRNIINSKNYLVMHILVDSKIQLAYTLQNGVKTSSTIEMSHFVDAAFKNTHFNDRHITNMIVNL
jgi:hypothetical protein